MSADNKSRVQALDEFLLNYLPWGSSEEHHELIVAMVEAARKHIVVELRRRGELDARDEDNQPMREGPAPV